MLAYLRDPEAVVKEIEEEGISDGYDGYAMFNFYEDYKTSIVEFEPISNTKKWFYNKCDGLKFRWHISWLRAVTEEKDGQLLLNFNNE